MADVARAAKVTSQTVSRAFRNTPDISKETRDRILKVAEDLKYVMNTTASSLRVGNSHQIVIVYDNLVNVYFSIMIDYLQNALRARGYSIMVLSVSDAHLNRSAYEIAVSHNAAGIISFLEPDEEIGGLVDHFAIPILLLGRRTEIRNVGFLRTNDEKVGELAAKRLIAEGVRRFAYVTIDLAVSCATDRLFGFEEEIKKNGGELTVLNAYEGSLEENLIKLFKNAETAPEGIFCFNDMLAFDVQYCIEKNALPSVKLVGCDCIQQELHIPNKLTSVGPDKQKLAIRAAEMIVSAVELPQGDRFAETADVFLFE